MVWLALKKTEICRPEMKAASWELGAFVAVGRYPAEKLSWEG